ncbi:MAG: hypothetical protein WA902_10750 [Thermosynechococcaceae cyanobacterium]
MTQAPPERLDRIESIFEKLDQKLDTMTEKMDRKLDAIAADIVEVKISQTRTEERLDSLEASVSEFKTETANKFDNLRDDIKGTDNRLWTLIVGVVLALFGLLAKMAFFPGSQL